MTTNENEDSGLYQTEGNPVRCWWCEGHADYESYHDDEWGHPVNDDRLLFEKICLEGFQAGLSWLTILRKRDNFRAAFDDFDFHRVAKFGKRDVTRLLKDAGIVRHRGKIEATINNAARAIEMEAEFGSLAAWFWQFEPDANRSPLVSRTAACQMTTCLNAVKLSKSLRQRGWKFVGPTTAYAFMQAMGMVNDHIAGCDQFSTVGQLRQSFERPN